jgi:cholesterol transport system auxiliary component
VTRWRDIPISMLDIYRRPGTGVVFLCALILNVGLLAGCSLKKQAPAKLAFVLEAHRPADKRSASDLATLRVRPLSVAAPFEGRNFVYRNSDLNYESDFYHEFLVAPRALLTEEVRQWLEGSGLFRAVLDPASKDEATHSLEGHVTELYGDFRSKAAPKGTLALRFLLMREGTSRSEIVFQKAYRQEVPADNRSPEALAKAWSKALQQILTALEQDLEKVRRPN